jgi:hypothetical protein
MNSAPKIVKIILFFLFILGLVSTCKKKRASVKSTSRGIEVCKEPPDLTSGLPLPTERKGSEFQKLLYDFLEKQKYRGLGWIKDQKIRDTGPMIGPLYKGTHPAVLIYYSHGVSKWQNSGRAGCIPDGSMIVKEMYDPPASRYDKLSGQPKVEYWTVMIRDQKGSRDGWYWSYFSTAAGASGEKQQIDSHDFPFHYHESGFGSYCVRCHSAALKFNTFTTKNHFEGPSFSPLPYHEYAGLAKTMGLFLSDFNLAGSVDQPKAAGAHSPSGKGLSGGLTSDVLNSDFVSQFNNYMHLSVDPSSVHSLKLPSVTHDRVPALPVAQEFVTSDQCMSCHDGDRSPFGVSARFPLGNMVQEEAEGTSLAKLGDRTVKLKNTSPYGEWRWSMMGLAGRDPIFFAQMETESTLFAGSSETVIDPQTKRPTQLNAAGIQNICFSCHGAMGQRQLTLDLKKGIKSIGPTFSAEMVQLESTSGDPHAKYGSLARDGISCMVCHQMEDNTDKKVIDIATGNFTVRPPQDNVNTVFGPREDVAEHYMVESLGIKPVKSDFISKSRVCATCHTVYLPVLDKSGLVKKWGYEQTTYLEWENSDFRDGGPAAKSCQSCHMPKDFMGKKNVAKMANVQDNEFPDSVVGNRHPEHLEGIFAPKDKLEIKVREDGISRHSLAGINLFGLEMFAQFDDILGVRKASYMSGINDGLESSIRNGATFAQNNTARVSIINGVRVGNKLSVKVQVENLAGHRLPSGVGFRRAFLELSVRDEASGKPIWSSGSTNRVGEIVDGATGQPLPSERNFQTTGTPIFQPHYQKITRQDQAQIYEELVTGENGQLTTSFLSIFGHLKDTRLLPKGWKKDGMENHDEEQKKALLPHLAMVQGQTDPDFEGGRDLVEYEITLPAQSGAVSLEAKLFYQPIPPRYLRDRFQTANGVSTKRLFYFASRLNVNKPHIKDWKTPLAQATGRY